ncbi:MAG: FAD-binding oxidoreductase [Oligoflexales bacterium]|nr:FAD-binding oxidoreductase [Oligoflexales bacterium]
MSKEIKILDERYQSYLEDESRLRGKAETISFPQSQADVEHIVQTLFSQGIPITIQGAKTGIAGGAVPSSGHILNLSFMKRITGLVREMSGNFQVSLEPGVTLEELQKSLAHGNFDTTGWDDASLRTFEEYRQSKRYFWPPDPTEASATIGGIASTNASGPCSLEYGPASHYIKAIRILDARGRAFLLRRGEYVFERGYLRLPDGEEIRLDQNILEKYVGTDLIDIYLGSEGMYGVITGLTLDLVRMPTQMWGIFFFFENEEGSAGFIESVREGRKPGDDARIVAIEFMDKNTIDSISLLRGTNSELRKFPSFPPGVVSLVYLELHGDDSEKIEAKLHEILDLSKRFGCNIDTTWSFSGENEIAKARKFRHAAPESVNRLIDKARLIDPQIRKLSSDISLRSLSFSDALKIYRDDLDHRGLKAAIFGHAGSSHLHVNFMPDDHLQYLAGKDLIEEWTNKAALLGENIAAENGIGKTKKHLLKVKPYEGYLTALRLIKKALDPQGLWNPTNMVD